MYFGNIILHKTLCRCLKHPHTTTKAPSTMHAKQISSMKVRKRVKNINQVHKVKQWRDGKGTCPFNIAPKREEYPSFDRGRYGARSPQAPEEVLVYRSLPFAPGSDYCTCRFDFLQHPRTSVQTDEGPKSILVCPNCKKKYRWFLFHTFYFYEARGFSSPRAFLFVWLSLPKE